MALQTENIIYSCDDVGSSVNSWQTISYGSAVQTNSLPGPNTSVTNYNSVNISITKTDPVPLVGGSAVIPEYWVDVTMGSGSYTDNLLKISQGIPITLSIYNCSGIYAKTNLWDNNLGGIEIDRLLTPNMNFIIGGDYKSYTTTSAPWGGGYWATGENINVTLTHSGVDILHPDSKTIKSVVWHYNLTGWFNLYLNLKLDLTNARAEYPFTHPDFYMSGCILSFDMLNKNGASVLKMSYSGITIDPPNIVGSITTPTNKTISDVDFSLSRDAVRGSITYTEIHNVIRNTYNMLDGKLEASVPWNYKNDGVATDSFRISNASMGRGGYCYMQYEPKLAGIKPGILGGIAYSNYVTNCKGHKYHINNPTVKMSVGATFGADILDSITNQNPYIFVDPVNSSGHIKITFDINPENWTTNTIRDNTPVSGIYPYISGFYTFAAVSNFVERELNNNHISYTAYDTSLTYPNVDITRIKLAQLANTADTSIITQVTPNTYTSLTSQSVILNPTKSGRYRIYLGVIDEFDQVSFWCITNKANSYNILDYSLSSF